MSTVRIDPEARERLHRLQDAWRELKGEQPSQKELLSRALEYLEDHRDEFLQASIWRPIAGEERERLRELAGRYDVEFQVGDVDAVAYSPGTILGEENA